jgi:DNA mismatch endonuclease (patch repair protein)
MNKINRNQERDKEVKQQLSKMGWHSITILECELKPSNKDKTLESLLYTLNKIFLLNYRVKPYKIVEEEMVMKVADDSDVEYGKINE